MIRKAIFFICGLAAATAPAAAQIDVEFHHDQRHHVSVVLAGTSVSDADETAFTAGLDYEYRLSKLLGAGFVVERAFGEIDSTTILAVADIHLWRGLAIQVGPGVEILEDEEYAVGRIGALYEFELDEGFTISPQFHYDASSGEDAIVFGVALGRGF